MLFSDPKLTVYWVSLDEEPRRLRIQPIPNRFPIDFPRIWFFSTAQNSYRKPAELEPKLVQSKEEAKYWSDQTIMSRLIGVLLLLVGLYFLGQNIIFSTMIYPPFFWRSLPALGSALAIAAGVVCLIFYPRQTGSWGWVLLVGGVVIVFISGGVMLRPTSLWNFFIGLTTLAVGFKLVTNRRRLF